MTPTPPTHKTTLATILSFIPLVLQALEAAFRINSEVGHATAAQVVTDSIAAGASIAGQIPEEHVQLVGSLATALAPTVGAIVAAGTNQPPPTPPQPAS